MPPTDVGLITDTPEPRYPETDFKRFMLRSGYSAQTPKPTCHAVQYYPYHQCEVLAILASAIYSTRFAGIGEFRGLQKRVSGPGKPSWGLGSSSADKLHGD